MGSVRVQYGVKVNVIFIVTSKLSEFITNNFTTILHEI